MALSNPSQPPLNRWGASLSLPLPRRSRRGFEPIEKFCYFNVMNYGKLNNTNIIFTVYELSCAAR